MIVFYGNRMYGMIHHIPGLCYIVTRFYYIQFIPLVPVESFLIFDEGDRTSGVKLKMHLGSVMMGYLRAALIIGAVIAAIAGLCNLNEYEDYVGMFYLPLAPIALAALWLSYRMNRLHHDHARDILLRAGLSEDFVEGFLSPPALPAGDALAGFAPGQQSYQSRVSSEPSQGGYDLDGARDGQGAQGITSKPAPPSHPENSSDRFSTDAQP